MQCDVTRYRTLWRCITAFTAAFVYVRGIIYFEKWVIHLAWMVLALLGHYMYRIDSDLKKTKGMDDTA